MGDLEDVATHEDYRHNLHLYRRLFDFQPAVIAVDMHPDYLSTQQGKAVAVEQDLALVEVQHHHAHIAGCMAEHGLPMDTGKVLGVALDGLGLGTDGTIWGGEFLVADYRGFERAAYFNPVPMLGGAQAMREPWRNTFAHLSYGMDWGRVCKLHGDLEIIQFLENKPLAILQKMASKGLNSPMASSAGRLFDAVAAALGLRRESAGYEGQAAIELEVLASGCFDQQSEFAYGFELRQGCISWAPLWAALLNDLEEKVEPDVIAARFHQGVALAVAQSAGVLCGQHNLETVVLSGGVFQNRLLLERTACLLRNQGLRVLSPEATPANDGGLSLGQAAIAFACHAT